MRLEAILSHDKCPLHTRIALAVVLLASLLTLYVWVKADEQPPQEEVFSFGDSKYPVLFAGDTIRRWEDVQRLGLFTPLFGAERRVVNPATPVVIERRTIRFDEPGEYYLEINREHYLKVLILDPLEPISKGVLRIFDFLVANLLVSNGEQPRWDEFGRDKYIQLWVHRKDPGLLLCGPTDAMFRALVFERFRLPNRMVTLYAVYRNTINGKISKSTHNVSEIYLPDIGKFVMFDLNGAFVARWHNAIDLAYLMRSDSDDTAYLTEAQWNGLDLDVYREGPKAFRPVRFNVLRGRDEAVAFSPELVSGIPVERYWVHMRMLYYGGVVYKGRAYAGTGFLTDDYNFGSLHADPELVKATVEWIKSYEVNSKVKVYSLSDLAQMLDRGFRDQLKAKAWLERVPGSVIHAGGKPNPA